MTLWGCSGCTTSFAVGLPACPHCGGTDHYEEGTMPKITRHAGPTDRRAPVVSPEPPEATPKPSEPAPGPKAPTRRPRARKTKP